jgi:peptide/nickel transport system substrate-binding protein
MPFTPVLRATILAVALASGTAAGAKTLRWSSQGDILTMDPHAQNEGLNNAVSDHIYEPLVTRGKDLKIEPCLATSWKALDATTVRFTLRPNVKFHDGTAFTADDVVFSIERALAPTSNFSPYMQGITSATKIDDLTVEIRTKGPNPVLLPQLTEVRVMSRAWAVKHGVQRPQDFKNKEETFAARNANGTGPYVLRSREADVKTVLVLNSNWWGKLEGNVNEIVDPPIRQDGTRLAALLSGEVDFVLDPPPQDIPRLRKDPKITVVEGNENRTVFFGFDQWRDELQYSSVKGKNPFKDPRVRRAFQLAIDVNALKTQVMRGLSIPTAVMFAPQVDGYDKALDVVVKPDRPNNRYINDEKLCQATAAMLAQVNVKVRLNSMPRATYFPKIQKFDTSFYMLGWGVPTFDSLYALQSLVRSVGQGGDGNFNLGKYSNAKVDAAVDALKTETDPAKRRALAKEALAIHQADVGHIPLHHQVIPWAMRAGVKVVHRADNRLTAKWVRID